MPLHRTALLLCLLSPFAATEEGFAMNISSPAFSHQGNIPKKYTCEGSDTSPPLTWSDVPAAARSLVLIVDDPDAPDPAAPRMTWVHWVLYDIPATVTGLQAGAAEPLPGSTRAGTNDFKRTRYGGPCPPVGRHRYFFKLYALDSSLGSLQPDTKAAVEKAMEGHVLAKAELIGLYQKRN